MRGKSNGSTFGHKKDSRVPQASLNGGRRPTGTRPYGYANSPTGRSKRSSISCRQALISSSAAERVDLPQLVPIHERKRGHCGGLTRPLIVFSAESADDKNGCAKSESLQDWGRNFPKIPKAVVKGESDGSGLL